MDFLQTSFLSFYVVEVEGKGEHLNKTYRHFQTLDEEDYGQHIKSIFGR